FSVSHWSPKGFSISVLLGLVLLLLKGGQLYWHRQRLLRIFQSFPGPPSHWFYGQNLELQKKEELKLIVSWAGKFPCAFPRWFTGFLASLLIYDPDYMKVTIKLGPFEASPASPLTLCLYFPGQGEALILNGPTWFQHRRAAGRLPSIRHPGKLPSSVQNKWEKLVSQGSNLEVFDDISLMTLDTIMKCAFSQESNCQMERSVMAGLATLPRQPRCYCWSGPCFPFL
uniref:Cytochrome P450 family 4 subfamily B member 1 n=1 Tax=Sarcophilus harrisii TaxID=9305 RepID=A0A7N4V6A0_SARHA